MQFPTMAESAIATWRAIPGTVAFNIVAKKAGAFRNDEFGVIVWVFPDETMVKITGRGKNYRIEAMLP